MAIEQEKMDEMMEQVRRWMKSHESEATVSLTLCKTGTPDVFKVRFDRRHLGILIMMMESDADLRDAAYSAMLKHFGEMDGMQRAAALREFADLCDEIHAHIEVALGGNAPAPSVKMFS